jgi:hypothetical protein
MRYAMRLVWWIGNAILGVLYFFLRFDSVVSTANPVVILAPLAWSGFCIYKAVKLKKENKTQDDRKEH